MMNNKTDTKNCSTCGKSILAVAQKCHHCKAWQTKEKGIHPPSTKQDTSDTSDFSCAGCGIVMLVVALFLTSVLRPSQARMEQAVAEDAFEHYLETANQAVGLIFGNKAQEFLGVLGDFAKDKAIVSFKERNQFYYEEPSPFHSVLYIQDPQTKGKIKVATGFWGMVFTSVERINFKGKEATSNKSWPIGSTTDSIPNNNHSRFNDSEDSGFKEIDTTSWQNYDTQEELE